MLIPTDILPFVEEEFRARGQPLPLRLDLANHLQPICAAILRASLPRSQRPPPGSSVTTKHGALLHLCSGRASVSLGCDGHTLLSQAVAGHLARNVQPVKVKP